MLEKSLEAGTIAQGPRGSCSMKGEPSMQGLLKQGRKIEIPNGGACGQDDEPHHLAQ